MASISSLFFSTDPEKDTLHKKIVPNSEQREMQQEIWNELFEHLKGALEEKTDYPISSWLQGSYKMGTQIRPPDSSGEFDIDLGLYFYWSGQPSDGIFLPEDLKKSVQDSLLDFDHTEIKAILSPPKERCERIIFESSFHIDIPVYHINEDEKISLATESNGWENSDPQKFSAWFSDIFEDEDNTQVRRLIRYFKMWSKLKMDESPSSIMLTVLVAEVYKGIDNTEDFGDDELVTLVAEELRKRITENSKVKNPVDATENLNRMDESHTSNFLYSLEELHSIGLRAAQAPDELAAANVWSEAFGHFFPLPIPEETSDNQFALLAYPFEPKIKISAVPAKNKYVSTYTGIDSIGPIPKDCNITFELDNHNSLPPGSTVRWIVRNQGEEAEFTNDLGHLAGTNLLFTEKHSAYKGTHYMDVIVTSSLGVMLGYKRVEVRILAGEIPPRSPLQKPFYRKIKRKS